MITHQDAPDGEAPGSEPGTFQGFSLPEAARLLGVSRSSVRRMIRDGRLEARRVLRPQGYAWEVRVPPCSEPCSEAPDVGTHHAPGPGRPNAPRQAPEVAGPEALGAWLVPVLTPILAPIVAELQATREAGERKDQTIERQAGEIAALREERGRQSAELERAASAVLTLHDELAAAEASRRREHRWLRIGLAVAGALAVAAGTAPAWVR